MSDLAATVLLAMTFFRYEHTPRHDVIAESIAVEAEVVAKETGLPAKELALAEVVITAAESGMWDKRVHSGQLRGDNGRAWCLGQLHRNPTFAPEPERLVGTDWRATRRCVAASMRVYAYHRKRCGGVRGAMFGYGTGWVCRPNKRLSGEANKALGQRVRRYYRLRAEVNQWMTENGGQG